MSKPQTGWIYQAGRKGHRRNEDHEAIVSWEHFVLLPTYSRYLKIAKRGIDVVHVLYVHSVSCTRCEKEEQK